MCAKFAPVAPPAILKDLRGKGLLGDYHLLLAHDIAAKPEEYVDIFGPRRALPPPEEYVILDNSLIELGRPADDDTIRKAWLTVKPNVTVLPDRLCDLASTMRESGKAAYHWSEALHIGPFMGVVQGKDWRELEICADFLASLPGVRALAVPRVVRDRVLTTRYAIITEIRKSHPDISIHLLGFSSDVEDDFYSAGHPAVMGIDSAVPIRAGLLGVSHRNLSEWNNLPPRGDFWESAKEVNTTAIENLQFVRAKIDIRTV